MMTIIVAKISSPQKCWKRNFIRWFCVFLWILKLTKNHHFKQINKRKSRLYKWCRERNCVRWSDSSWREAKFSVWLQLSHRGDTFGAIDQTKKLNENFHFQFESVFLGSNTYPDHIQNATCGTHLKCQHFPSYVCHPIYRNVRKRNF